MCAAVAGASWAKIEHKTAATAEEVHRAGDLGPLLIAALGVREHGTTATPAEAADRKVRAFTLFTTAYDQVRRGVTYLRWNEGDADSLAPCFTRGGEVRATRAGRRGRGVAMWSRRSRRRGAVATGRRRAGRRVPGSWLLLGDR